MDLTGTSQPPPTPPRQRGLTAVISGAGFLISIPIFTIAAVAGFARGWQGAPRIIEGENIIQPFVHLGWALAGAALYAMIAMAAVAIVAILTIFIHHRRHGAEHPSTSKETDHIP